MKKNINFQAKEKSQFFKYSDSFVFDLLSHKAKFHHHILPVFTDISDSATKAQKTLSFRSLQWITRLATLMILFTAWFWLFLFWGFLISVFGLAHMILFANHLSFAWYLTLNMPKVLLSVLNSPSCFCIILHPSYLTPSLLSFCFSLVDAGCSWSSVYYQIYVIKKKIYYLLYARPLTSIIDGKKIVAIKLII